MRTLLILSACGLAMMTVAAKSWAGEARIITATYAGSVGGGFDPGGVFGSPGEDIEDYTFTAAFTFNDSRGYRAATPTFDDLIGGTNINNTPASPLISAKLSINGTTVSFSGVFSSEDLTVEDVLYSSSVYDQTKMGLSSQLYFSFGALNAPVSLDTPFVAEGLDEDGGFIYNDLRGFVDYADLRPDSLIVTVAEAPISAAPEPGLWALMIAGVALIGATLRRRPRALAVASLSALSLLRFRKLADPVFSELEE